MTPWQLLDSHTSPQIEELRVFYNLPYWEGRIEKGRIASREEKLAFFKKHLQPGK